MAENRERRPNAEEEKNSEQQNVIKNGKIAGNSERILRLDELKTAENSKMERKKQLKTAGNS